MTVYVLIEVYLNSIETLQETILCSQLDDTPYTGPRILLAS